MASIQTTVSEYYGKTVQKTEDLLYSACCIDDYNPELLKHLTDEVLDRRYGCGSPLPVGCEGITVLDLGCGSGADCFIASKLVGEHGFVYGLDMTDEQLEVANRNAGPIGDNLGYHNTEFIKGEIESIPLADATVDLVISNCVINLSDNKAAVFDEIFRVLKPGGEFYISDIVADRRIPQSLKDDPILYSECLSGAAYQQDLLRMVKRAGFADPRLVKQRALAEVIQGVHFNSIILRAFRIELEDACEDFGQVAIYQGTIPDHPSQFVLDDHHLFVAGKATRVCGNTADMLTQSRLAKYFAVTPRLAHLGLFDCAPVIPSENQANASASCC